MYVFYHLTVGTLLLGFLTTSSVATCNVTLHATTTPQNFTSPNYPNHYNNNDSCFWDLVPSTPGYNIIFDMVYSDMEGSMHLCFDQLIIFNVTSRRIIRKICGTKRWLMNLRGPSPVRVIFKTDESQTRSGFLIRYFETPDTSDCGGTLIATSTDQYFISPGFPNTYYLGLSCTWIIRSQSSNDVVLLETVRSDIDATGRCSGDNAAVYNGESTDFLGRFCGTEKPVFVSGGNTLKVLFTTDQQTNRMGFQMKYKSLPASGYSVTIPASLYEESIVSPRYPANFVKNVNCSWTIVPPRLHSVEARVSVYDVPQNSRNCSQGRLTFNSVYTNGTQVLDSVCNNWSSVRRYQVNGNMTVTFTSDGTDRLSRGVKVLYQMVTPHGHCGETSLVARSYLQYLISPNFPNPYYSNDRCTWTIQAYATFNRVLMVTNTSQMGAFSSRQCADYVNIYDGPYTSNSLLGKMCAWAQPSYISSGQYMTIVFASDSSQNWKGFKIGHTTINGLRTSCGTTSITASFYPHYLTSPGYPYNYQNNMECTWTIHAQAGRVHVSVLSAELEEHSPCSFDTLHFYDGNSVYDRQLGVLCGSQTDTYYSTSNYLTIKFTSDNTIVFKGFRLKYEAVNSQAPCGTTQLTASTEGHGYLYSPGYPSFYSNNVDCQWTITASAGQQIKVEILSLNIEYSTSCVSDYLMFNDGYLSTSSQLTKLCGTAINGPITSTRNSMVITFHTDSTTTDPGFRLQYIALEDNRRSIEIDHFTTTYISSPNYPSNYGNNLDYRWTIHASYPYVVSMTVVSSSLESSENCEFDYVEAFDGETDAATSLGRWCGSETPDKHSSGQYMYIKFKSDGSTSRSGFKLGFTAEEASEYNRRSIEIEHFTTTYISSPNYPSNYGNNLDYGWTIHASHPYVVSMTVVSSSLESSVNCEFDYVEAFDGETDAATSLGRWCGSETPDKHSSGQYMYIKFKSDGSTSSSGFQLGFTAEEASEFNKNSHVNVGGIIGGIVGAVVILALVACCVSTNRKRANSNNIRSTNRQTSCQRHVMPGINSDIYSITSGNYPMSVRPQPATFMPPPAYSEVVKDDPPRYSEAVDSLNNRPKNNQAATPTVSDGAGVLQGVDNPAGPQNDET